MNVKAKKKETPRQKRRGFFLSGFKLKKELCKGQMTE